MQNIYLFWKDQTQHKSTMLCPNKNVPAGPIFKMVWWPLTRQLKVKRPSHQNSQSKFSNFSWFRDDVGRIAVKCILRDLGYEHETWDAKFSNILGYLEDNVDTQHQKIMVNHFQFARNAKITEEQAMNSTAQLDQWRATMASKGGAVKEMKLAFHFIGSDAEHSFIQLEDAMKGKTNSQSISFKVSFPQSFHPIWPNLTQFWPVKWPKMTYWFMIIFRMEMTIQFEQSNSMTTSCSWITIVASMKNLNDQMSFPF